MNKKGFTLIELLAVIIILSSLIMLFAPTVGNVINNSKNTISKNQVNDILTAAYNWSLKNIDDLPNPENKKYITLARLKKDGFIDYNITNPETKELYSDALVISIKNDKDSSLGDKEKREGNFVYKIEDAKSNIADIPVVLGENVYESNGNYTLEIPLNFDLETLKSSFNTVITINDTNIDAISFITYKDNPISIDNIKTDKVGMYKVKYTFLNITNGESKSIELTIFITAEE